MDQYFRCADVSAEKALREQEPLIQSHIDLLITKLHRQISGSNNGVVNMVSPLLGCNAWQKADYLANE